MGLDSGAIGSRSSLKLFAASLVAIPLLAAGCGGSHRRTVEGRYASFFTSPDQISKFEAWRSPAGTLYLREIPISSCPPRAMCPSTGQRGYAGPAVIGRRNLDLVRGRVVYRSGRAMLWKVYYDAYGPDPLRLGRALQRGRLTPIPAWAAETRRSLEMGARESAHLLPGVGGVFGPFPIWAGRQALGKPLTTIVEGTGMTVFVYGSAGPSGYTLDVFQVTAQPAMPKVQPRHALRVRMNGEYTVDIYARTARERRALRRLLRWAPQCLSIPNPPPC
jgi:hypothetical protein